MPEGSEGSVGGKERMEQNELMNFLTDKFGSERVNEMIDALSHDEDYKEMIEIGEIDVLKLFRPNFEDIANASQFEEADQKMIQKVGQERAKKIIEKKNMAISVAKAVIEFLDSH